MGPSEFDLNVEEKRDCRKTPFPYPITMMKGYKNAGLTRDTASFIIEHPVALELYNWLQDTLVPDEHYIPTLVTINVTKLAPEVDDDPSDPDKQRMLDESPDEYDEVLSEESLNDPRNGQLHLPKGDLKALGELDQELPHIETLYSVSQTDYFPGQK